MQRRAVALVGALLGLIAVVVTTGKSCAPPEVKRASGSDWVPVVRTPAAAVASRETSISRSASGGLNEVVVEHQLPTYC